MDLNQITYFLNLAETLNFTEAAKLSGISQPSLTNSIKKLEEELGGNLLHRDGKDTRLTALGREMQVEFMRLDKMVSNIHELAENSVLGKRQTLNIGVAITVSPNSLAAFWTHVVAQLPSLTVYFHAMLPGESENEVLTGKYDMCILPEPPKENFKLVRQILFNEKLMLAVSKNHPLAKQNRISEEQMAAEPYIDRLHCGFRTQVIHHFMDRNIVMKPRIQSEREDWVQQLIAEGAGVASLPERSRIIEGIALKPVENLELSRDITLVSVSGSGTAREVRQINDMAQSYAW